MPVTNCSASVLVSVPKVEQIHLLTVRWDETTPAPGAGQFYMLRAWAAEEAPILSRPISVHSFDADQKEISFLIEVKGKGTEKLAALQAGDTVQMTGPVGTGFPIETLHGTVAVVGGGIGTAPLLQLAKELQQKGTDVHFYGGYRKMPVQLEAFEAYTERMEVATESGTFGYKGFVTDLLDVTLYDAICTCGPDIMMQKVASMAIAKNIPVYVSLEAKMACGIGACLGCTCHTKNGGISVCKEGPVVEGGRVYG